MPVSSYAPQPSSVAAEGTVPPVVVDENAHVMGNGTVGVPGSSLAGRSPVADAADLQPPPTWLVASSARLGPSLSSHLEVPSITFAGVSYKLSVQRLHEPTVKTPDENPRPSTADKALKHSRAQLQALGTLRECCKPPMHHSQLVVKRHCDAAQFQSTAVAQIPPDMRAYALDPAMFRSSDLWTVAYSGTPDAIEKSIKEECDTFRSSKVEVVNALGYVCFDQRRLGIKKLRGTYVLGLGSKASPLQLAAAAGRLDNCLQLLRDGAAPNVGSPSATDIAKANGFTAITELIEMFSKKSVHRKGHKPTNCQPLDARPQPPTTSSAAGNIPQAPVLAPIATAAPSQVQLAGAQAAGATVFVSHVPAPQAPTNVGPQATQRAPDP